MGEGDRILDLRVFWTREDRASSESESLSEDEDADPERESFKAGQMRMRRGKR